MDDPEDNVKSPAIEVAASNSDSDPGITCAICQLSGVQRTSTNEKSNSLSILGLICLTQRSSLLGTLNFH